jgi:predicted ribosomally synthesized peptide with SipW-like signal peptide
MLRDLRGPRVLASVRVRAALALGVLVAPLGVNTMAYWSDRVVVEPGTVRAGTLDLKVNGADSLQQAGLSVADMAPGATTAAAFVVRNASTGDNAVLTYTVDATAIDAAPTGTSAALTARVTTGSVKVDGADTVCTGSRMRPSGTSFNGPLVSNPRRLDAGDDQTLCVEATLGSEAPAEGRSTITLTFTAVQKDPNP